MLCEYTEWERSLGLTVWGCVEGGVEVGGVGRLWGGVGESGYHQGASGVLGVVGCGLGVVGCGASSLLSTPPRLSLLTSPS